jgi:hypothetical protein
MPEFYRALLKVWGTPVLHGAHAVSGGTCETPAASYGTLGTPADSCGTSWTPVCIQETLCCLAPPPLYSPLLPRCYSHHSYQMRGWHNAKHMISCYMYNQHFFLNITIISKYISMFTTDIRDAYLLVRIQLVCWVSFLWLIFLFFTLKFCPEPRWVPLHSVWK